MLLLRVTVVTRARVPRPCRYCQMGLPLASTRRFLSGCVEVGVGVGVGMGMGMGMGVGVGVDVNMGVGAGVGENVSRMTSRGEGQEVRYALPLA